MDKTRSQSALSTKATLQEAGFRATKARIAVLEHLERSAKPVSAKAVFEALGKKGSIDKVTVYRILHGFVETGLARLIDFRHGHALYESATREHHHHIICEQCKTVSHIDCDLSDFQMGAKKGAGFALIREHSLEFFGICNTCYAK